MILSFCVWSVRNRNTVRLTQVVISFIFSFFSVSYFPWDDTACITSGRITVIENTSEVDEKQDPPRNPTPQFVHHPEYASCRSCKAMCSQVGMACCGNGVDCDCSPLSSCPKCGPPAPPPYDGCSAGCPECISTQGVPGNICSPPCSKPNGVCPAVTIKGVTAIPTCE